MLYDLALRALRLLPHSFDVPDRRPHWEADPLSHPDLSRMTEREIADLPFDPAVIPGIGAAGAPVRLLHFPDRLRHARAPAHADRS
ncbi:hypothetical protein [Hoeflea marina]|uniref:hypothetical protein n=1 Tax=Hoeflea marina TaxID=274592 RepID=UPI000D7173D8|nr:hypothetical protein [Hoeflea marina]